MELKLKVAEASKNDVGRGIVRLDNESRGKLGVSVGDFVEISGEGSTGAVVWRAYEDDEGLGIIRMDGYLRQNINVSIGDEVLVKKTRAKEAKRVVLAPNHAIRFSPGFNDFVKRRLIGRPLTMSDVIIVSVLGTPIRFTVIQTNPPGIVQIFDHTQVVVKEEPSKIEKVGIPSVTYEDIGGLVNEVQKVREMIELPMKHPELFEKLGIEPPKGVLLHGPPGTGKTLIAKAVANESNAYFKAINGPEIMSKFYGESEKRLREIFEEAEESAPSIVFIDELDAIAPKREEVTGEVERRVVAQLLSLMDGLKARGKLIVIGATNRPDALDPALRRPGRFDREIVIGVPDRNGRKEILQIHTRGMPLHWITPEEKKWEDLDLLSKVDELIKRAKEINSDIDVNEIDREKIDEKIKDFKKFKIVLARSKDSKSVLKSEDKANIEREVTNFKKFLRDLDLLSRADALIKRAEDIKADSHVDKGEREKIDKKIKDLKGVLASGDKDNIEGEVEDFEKFVKEKEVEVYIIEEYADRTHGFVGADLESLCKESAMSALRRILPEIDLKEETIPPEVLEKLEITQKDFHEAFKNIEPSALREVFIEVSNVRWKDIGGLKDVKRDLREMVEWPIKNPQMFTKMGIKPPKGILLFGPPGTGKTLLAKAVANESEANFISVKGPEVLSKWVGESEKAVREIFKKAKQAAPTIIFFDEVDAIVSQRGVEVGTRVGERLVNQLLTEMDGLEELHNVVVIAATNRPDMLDPGLLRPGRIDRRMMIPAPDEDARKEIFKVHTRNMPLRKDVDMERLAKRTDGYVGADIESICREAAMLAIREVLEKGADVDKKKVELRHFDKAMEIVKPSVSKEWKKFYERFLETYEAREPEQLGYMR